MYELRQLLFTHLSGKLHARQSRRRQELSELLFRRRPFQWHTVQEQLRSGRPQQQSLVGTFRDRGAQFVPRNTQLFGGSSVVVSVEPGKFQENIQTSDKSSACGGLGVRFHRVKWHVIPVLQRGSA